MDRDLREELHARANAVGELRGELSSYMNDAVKIVSDLERDEKRKKVK